jgi:hypothetical protein
MAIEEQDPPGLLFRIGERIRRHGVRLSRRRERRRNSNEHGRSRKSSQWH